MSGVRFPADYQLERLCKSHRRKAFASGHPLVDEWLAVGALVGLCLLTKTTAYVTVPLVLVALLLERWQHRTSWRRLLAAAGQVA